MSQFSNTLIFLHIPKTAGSTFHSILGRNYKHKLTHNVFGSRYSDPEISKFVKNKNNKSKIQLLKGHMPFGLHNHTPNRCQYITILRDPVERVISQYYYIKKNSFNPLHNEVVGNRMSISDFVESGIAIGMNNGQCRFINGDIDEFPFNQENDLLLENTKNNIKNYFIWTGLTERFDESILVLANKLQWANLPYYFVNNVSKTRKKQQEIDENIINTIKKYNSLDIKLYMHANTLLDDEIRDIPNFQNSLERFRKKNQLKQKRWGWLPDRARSYFVNI